LLFGDVRSPNCASIIMTSVSLLRRQCLHSFQLGNRTSLRLLRSISCIGITRKLSDPSQSPQRVSPRTPTQVRLRPSPSILSNLSSREFSTPTKKPEIHENLYTIPNILTFSRLLSTPIIAYLILHDKPYLATSLLLYAGLTDLVDGWIARRYNLKTVVGTIIDPMADKFLMITLTGALAYTGAMPGTSTFAACVNGSLACSHNTGKGCRVGNFGVVLSIHFITSTKDILEILGFLITFGGSASYYN
jgi:phosphatidylglycerophosphate synthase